MPHGVNRRGSLRKKHTHHRNLRKQAKELKEAQCAKKIKEKRRVEGRTQKNATDNEPCKVATVAQDFMMIRSLIASRGVISACYARSGMTVRL